MKQKHIVQGVAYPFQFIGGDGVNGGPWQHFVDLGLDEGKGAELHVHNIRACDHLWASPQHPQEPLDHLPQLVAAGAGNSNTLRGFISYIRGHTESTNPWNKSWCLFYS